MKIILENWHLFTESHTKEQEEELKTIVGELENASKMHAGQAKRIQQILDETDDDKLEEGEKKNCGCGSDPCITYGIQEEKELEEDCQDGYERVPGSKEFAPGSCREKTDESLDLEAIVKEELETVLAEKKKKKRKKKKGGKKDACYHKVKSRYDVWPSAYASGALVKCRKVGAKNWGNKSKKKNESFDIFGNIMMEEDLATFINEEGLKDWFDDADGDGQGEWEQVGGKYDGKPCAKQPGQKTKPKCVSPEKAATMSKDEKENAAKRKRAKDPNPNRKGKAKNVNTDPKNESIEITKESLDLETIIREELDAVLAEKKKKPCKPSKGKRFAKRVNGKCRSFGQKGQAKGGGDRIRPGTKKGDAYCARSAKIKKCKNPPCANALSRKKWKCRGSKSMKE